MNPLGKYLFVGFVLVLFGLCPRSVARGSDGLVPSDAEQLMTLTNQARAGAGEPALVWDPALAEAARKHTLRMVAEGPIEHRYPGELELSERAGLAGAHFNLIAENIAIGSTPGEIHDAWMHSEGHRENLLDPEVNRVGIAVMESRGVLYTTADYSRSVEDMSQAQVEERVSALITPSGVKVLADHDLARTACTADRGLPAVRTGAVQPTFIMRWQDSDLGRLPKNLVDQLASGRFRQAAVGSCAPTGAAGSFTAYRVAVLLY